MATPLSKVYTTVSIPYLGEAKLTRGDLIKIVALVVGAILIGAGCACKNPLSAYIVGGVGTLLIVAVMVVSAVQYLRKKPPKKAAVVSDPPPLPVQPGPRTESRASEPKVRSRGSAKKKTGRRRISRRAAEQPKQDRAARAILRWYPVARRRRIERIKQFVEEHFTVIATNVDLSNFENFLRARLIGLGEDHAHPQDKILINRLIDLMYRGAVGPVDGRPGIASDRVLVETGSRAKNDQARQNPPQMPGERVYSSQTALVNQPIRVAFWDAPIDFGIYREYLALEKDIERFFENRNRSSEDFLYLIDRYKEFISEEDRQVLSKIVEFLYSLDVEERRLHTDFSTFFAGFITTVYYNLRRIENETTEKQFLLRQQSLCEVVQEEVDLGTPHVFTIYGKNHGNPENGDTRAEKEGAQYFQDYLRDSSFPYVLLEPKHDATPPAYFRWPRPRPVQKKSPLRTNVSAESRIIAWAQDYRDYMYAYREWKTRVTGKRSWEQ